MPNAVIEALEKLSNKLTSNLKLTYLIAFIAGTIPFLIIMYIYNWDFIAFWSVGFLSFLTMGSGIVMKFLGGFGLILTYAWGCAFALRLFSKQIKGDKKAANRMKLVLIIGSLFLVGYGVYTILTNILFTPGRDIITTVLTLYGIISLMLQVYIIPAVRDQFKPSKRPSFWQRVKGRFGNFKYSLWKGYQTRVRKDFGKVFAAEYGRYKLELEDIRDQLSGVLLLPITIIYIGFLPLFGISIILWLRIFSQNQRGFTNLEKILLILVVGTLMVLSIILFFVITNPKIYIYFNVSYGIALICSVVLFMYVLRKA
jgi:hypothetical protein